MDFASRHYLAPLIAVCAVGLATLAAIAQESRLPAGGAVLDTQPTAWEQYWPYISGVVVIIAIQAASIVALRLRRTRRTGAEPALRESEERFRLMTDGAPVMVWTAGPDMMCDYFNSSCMEFTGRLIEQLLGNGWADAVHPEDWAGCERTYVPAFNARAPFRMEYRLRRADGAYRWVLDSGVPKFGPDGGFAGYIGSCIDITERKDAEGALFASQERYTLATAAAGVGVWDWSVGTNELFVDPEIKRLLGFGDAELPNHVEAWEARVHEEDVAAVMAMARNNRDTAVHEMEHRMLHRDGSVRWFLSRGSVLRRSDGTASRVIGTSIDITDRKRAEELIRASRAALKESHRRIQHLAGRLLEAQDTERARVARDLHDDVSQQLAGLSIAVSALKHRMSELPGSEGLQEDLRALQRRTSTLAESVRHLSHDLHPTVLEHAGLVAALSAHSAELERAHGIACQCHAQGDFESIAPEAALCLYRIAQEALRNVVAHAGATRADVRLRRIDDRAEITIADDGKGLDLARCHESAKGLGLVSMTERVRLAGGTLSIVTELNKGTQLRAQIPAIARAKPTADADAEGRVA
jgi:PAS domain S-box-containing protein